MEDWKQELEEILEDETDTGESMIPKYARCYARIILENFIEQEIEKAREEGVKDGMRGMIDILCEKGCGSMFAVIEEKDVNKKIEELSKLKTK